MSNDFSFSRFVETKEKGSFGRDEATRYAYSADVTMLKGFQKVRPVELAAAATVRTFKKMMKNQLLGTMVKVSPRQFPSIYKIAEHCAQTLTVPVPQVYIANSPVINAYTFGTDEESFIVLHSALIDHFNEDELKFVIGHETGHIQNKHVVYGTALRVLTQTAGIFLAWIVQPAVLALSAWSRRAEITCDRAGLLCCGSLDAACNSFLKLATGSHKLYAEMSFDAYMEQFEEGQSGAGRIQEAFASHPYIPKRAKALQVFADSALYREAMGFGRGGLDMEDVDEKTSEIIQIVTKEDILPGRGE